MTRICKTCGNHYERMFSVRTHAGEEFDFDCFECAINYLAPRCQQCGVPMIGHGVEIDQVMYCCTNCARQSHKDVMLDQDGLADPNLGAEGGGGAQYYHGGHNPSVNP